MLLLTRRHANGGGGTPTPKGVEVYVHKVSAAKCVNPPKCMYVHNVCVKGV